MGAYNKVRGTHAAHNKLLNNDILKGEWGFDGCVVTDWELRMIRMKLRYVWIRS